MIQMSKVKLFSCLTFKDQKSNCFDVWHLNVESQSDMYVAHQTL